jgi:hypothetical protein
MTLTTHPAPADVALRILVVNLKRILVGLITVLPLIAGAQNGLDLLKEAEKTMQSMSFSAECIWSSGTKVMVLQKPGEHGTLIRREFVSEFFGTTTTTTYIYNETGCWRLGNNQALCQIYLNFTNCSPFFGLVARGLDISAPASYTAQTDVKNGAEVFEISQRYDQPRYGVLKNTLHIGRADHIIYDYVSQQKNGTESMTVTNFKVLQDIPTELFYPPSGATVTLCTNSAQYAAITTSWIREVANTPTFKKSVIEFQKTQKKKGILVWILLLIPTGLLVFFTLKHRMRTQANLESDPSSKPNQTKGNE